MSSAPSPPSSASWSFSSLVHELGHFIVAKRAGITVEEFGIGFPPRIASIMWHGTRYSLNWIPLGGFVRMLGEDGDVEIRRLREKGLSEPEVEHAMAGAFNRRPIWIRIGVLLAGVVMNFVLAGALFSVVVQPAAAGRPRPADDASTSRTTAPPPASSRSATSSRRPTARYSSARATSPPTSPSTPASRSP